MRKTIGDAVKTAMKAGEKTRLGTLRLISAKIKDADLAAQGAGKNEATAGELVEVLARMVKQRRESIDQFSKGNRPDLVEQEQAEIVIIEEYLPQGLSAAETGEAISALIKETGAATVKDMGKVMGLLKERYAGRMDFTAASAAVKARLSGG